MRLIVGDELKRDLQRIITNYNEEHVQETCYDVFADDIKFRDNLLSCDTTVDVPANYILQICPAMSFQRKFIGKCFVPFYVLPGHKCVITVPHKCREIEKTNDGASYKINYFVKGSEVIGKHVANLMLFKLDTPVEKLYDGQYQNEGLK